MPQKQFWERLKKWKQKTTMTKICILLAVAAFSTIAIAKSKPNDCDGVKCQDFCCDAGQQCCYDSWSGTYFCVLFFFIN